MKPMENFCFYWTLETGVYVLSTIGLITCILSIILTSLVLGQIIRLSLPDFLLIFQQTWSLIQLVLFILVIYGTKKRRNNLLAPYLIFGFADLIINAFSFLAYQIITFDHDTASRIVISVRYVFIGTVAFYTWYCILTFFTKRIIEERANDSSNLVQVS